MAANGISLSNASIEEAIKLKPHLQRYATRLRNLDKDGNQVLELEEVCEAIEDMVELEKQRRMLKWVAIILAIFAVFITLATVGLTWAVVALSKDTKVDSGVLVTKTGESLSLGSYSLALNPLDGTEDAQEIVVGRRLLQDGSTQKVCKPAVGRIESYAIRDLCNRVLSNDMTFILKLADKNCRSQGAVIVDDTANSIAKEGFACATDIIDVKVTRHICSLFNNDQPLACNNGIDDKEKAAKTWEIVQAFETYPNPGTKYFIEFKANCSSVDDPKFVEWFLSGQLRAEAPCNATIAPTPAPVPVPVPAPAPAKGKPKPKPKGPFTSSSPAPAPEVPALGPVVSRGEQPM